MEVWGNEAVTLIWEEYQGIKVEICQEEIKARHPRHGYNADKMWDLKEASLLLLEDETYLVVCDCGYNGLTGKRPYATPRGPYKDITKQVDSVMAHKSATHWVKNIRGSLYSDKEIRTIISIYLKWRDIGGKDWNARALDEIDLLGIKAISGDKVTESSVRNVIARYRHKPQFADVKPAPALDGAREILEAQIREAAAKAAQGSSFRHSVATEARITERKGVKRRTPIDFDTIIEKHKADKAFQERLAPEKTPEPLTTQQETDVSAKLTFGSPIKAATPIQKRTDVVLAPVPAPRAPEVVVEQPQPAKSDFELVAELPDGILFRYKGTQLMVGKKAKIEIEA